MQADETIVVHFEYGVMLNNGTVVEMPSPDPEVAHAAAKSMVQAVNNGAYPGQGRASVVSRKVETKVAKWVMM